MASLFSMPLEIVLHIITYLSEGDISRLARTNPRVSPAVMTPLYRRNILESKGSALLHLADNDHTSALEQYVESEEHYPHSLRRTLRSDNVFFEYNPHFVDGTQAQYQARRRYQIKNHANYGPLVRAVHRGCHKTVNLLLKMGFDPTIRPDAPQRSLLAYAASTGHLEITRAILYKLRASNKGCPTYYLEEAVSAACTGTHARVVDCLLDNIAGRAHSRSSTLVQELCRANLPAAVRAGHLALCQVLIVRLRNVDFYSVQYDATPLQLAVRSYHPALVHMLLVKGAKPDVVLPGMNMSEGSALTEAARLGNKDIIEALIVAGARDDVRDSRWFDARDYMKRNKEREEERRRDRERAREAQAEQREALRRLREETEADRERERPGTISAKFSATCTCGASMFQST